MPLTSQVQELGSKVLDLIFPPRCVHCKKVGEGQLCQTCRADFQAVDRSQVCPHCGRDDGFGFSCHACQQQIPPAAPVYSGFVHTGPVQSAIWALKYANHRSLARDLADAVAQLIPAQSFNHFDALCPIPLHPDRRAERGFNQSRLLAAHISRSWDDMPVLPSGVVRRIRHTDAQVGLNHADRQLNVSGAFGADTQAVHGKSIVLVDDVCTTGATLNACADALHQAGALRVAALTISRAPSRVEQ